MDPEWFEIVGKLGVNYTLGMFNVVYMIIMMSVINECVMKLDTTLLNPHALEGIVISRSIQNSPSEDCVVHI